MPIHFSCPYCGETTLVDDQFAGHSGPCINCGKVVTVPSAQPAFTLQTAMQGLQRGKHQATIIIVLFLIGFGIGLFSVYRLFGIPAIAAARQASAKRTCLHNLRKIGQALLAYEETYGEFPPAYTVDQTGQRLHSWRVLILPYLGPAEKGLYQRIALDEPWNSPRNLQFQSQMPRVFASPLDENALNAHESSYLAIVGQRTMFPDAKPRKRTEITDGEAHTLLLVEAKSNGHSWMEPYDLNDVIEYQIGGDIGGNHNDGVTVLFADGEPRFLSDLTPDEDIKAMSTVDGNELVLRPDE
jgi:prepilin-type processing-associated H-X9-DG protein